LIVPITGTKVPNMGSIPPQSIPSAKAPRTSHFGSALFTETQQRVLGFLFGQPQRSFYAKELIKLTASGSGAVQRELKRLETSGLVTVRWQGNQKHYQANPEAPIFSELCGIAQKTFGLAEPIRERLSRLPNKIKAAFVYGSVAKQSEHAASDIDLFVISSEVTYGQLMVILESAEPILGRRINPTLYTPDDFQQRRAQRNSFLMRVLEQPKIWLIGSDHDLGA
jgi:predicted nucleotidyltransferase